MKKKVMKADVIQYSKNLSNTITNNQIAIVIDVFRATSVIVTALAHGAKEIITTCEIEEAFDMRKKCGQVKCILGGERNMHKISGFDFGNSPLSYIKGVKDKTVILTTTNGTQAINFCKNAFLVYIASFLNAEYTAKTVEKLNKDIVIVCSGIANSFALEDALCAGLLLSHLSEYVNLQLSDFAWLLKNIYEVNKNNISDFISNASAITTLQEQGFKEDIDFCMQHNIYAIAPQYKDEKITI